MFMLIKSTIHKIIYIYFVYNDTHINRYKCMLLDLLKIIDVPEKDADDRWQLLNNLTKECDSYEKKKIP